MNSIRWLSLQKGSKTQSPKFEQQSPITSKRYEIGFSYY